MLTDARCRTAKPKPKPYKLPDGKGLYLEVKPSGVKAWRYRFKLAKENTVKESMFAIGDYASAPHSETQTKRTPAARVGASPWPKHGMNALRLARW